MEIKRWCLKLIIFDSKFITKDTIFRYINKCKPFLSGNWASKTETKEFIFEYSVCYKNLSGLAWKFRVFATNWTFLLKIGLFIGLLKFSIIGKKIILEQKNFSIIRIIIFFENTRAVMQKKILYFERAPARAHRMSAAAVCAIWKSARRLKI